MQQHVEDKSESSDNSSRTATGKDSRFGKETTEYHLPHGYGYQPSQQPLPDTPQLYQHPPFILTHRLQPTTRASEAYPTCGHSGKDMTCPKVDMVGLMCSPLGRLQNKVCHLQGHRGCLQDCRITIQSIGPHIQALILHLNLLLVQQEDPLLASQRQDSGRLWNHGKR
jgi:hypothetical protein